MRNRILLPLVGVALLVAGMVGGIAIGSHMTAQAAAAQRYTVRAAANSPLSKYCATYEQALANDLHLAPGTLEQANIDALTQVLDQMVTDGQLTKTERDQLVPLLKQIGVAPCTEIDGKAIAKYLQNDPLLAQQALAAHAALTAAVAGALHMTPDALATALGNGKTVPQLATQQGIAIATVRAAYLSAAQSFLAQAVSSGLITQAQADSLNKLAAQAVAKDAYPLLSLGSLATMGSLGS
jgi:hypothetical protein